MMRLEEIIYKINALDAAAMQAALQAHVQGS